MMENNEYFNQRIDCDVDNCKYHDPTDGRCTLGKIKVSSKDVENDTFCDSFERNENDLSNW